MNYKAGTLYFAGCCRPNPGKAAVGAVIYEDGYMPDNNSCSFVTTLTSNAAHYLALIVGLERALQLGFTDILARGHSELVCMQVSGDRNVYNRRLKRYRRRVMELSGQFRYLSVQHVYRRNNLKAVSLARSKLP